MVAVRFFGPVGDSTGYGTAVTNFAKSFSNSKIQTKFNFNSSNFSKKLLPILNNYNGNTQIDFYLHCPPYNKHSSKAYKIGYFYWEADRLPRPWVKEIKEVDELWVPCQLVKEACLKANFNGPIKIVPTPCEDWEEERQIKIPSSFSNDFVLNENVYKFYSIFQWQNRKGFNILLNSYLKTFNKKDNVILILKVNPLNIKDYTENKIKTDILEIKRKLNLKYYPPIYLSTEIVSTDIIRMLHNTGDCYVSPHHGEGWGVPIHDAMRMGKQLIVTQFGGVTEFLDQESAHIIKHSLGPVTGMEWSSLYGGYQSWAYPSQHHLSLLFRDVYDNHKQYQNMGYKAKEIADTMTIKSLANLISKELGTR